MYPHQMLFISHIDILEKDDLIYLYSFINLHADFPVIASCAKENRERVKSVFDLYETVEIPPIRTRKEDIPFILSSLISQISQEHNLKLSFPTKKTIELCKNYSWPANYSELRDFTQLYCLNGPLKALEGFLNGVEYIEEEEQLPDLNVFQSQLKMTTEEILVKKVMELTQNNRKKAASLLGISYKSLSKKLKLYSNSDEE
jgi:DNA-binding NtrC family response regulator